MKTRNINSMAEAAIHFCVKVFRQIIDQIFLMELEFPKKDVFLGIKPILSHLNNNPRMIIYMQSRSKPNINWDRKSEIASYRTINEFCSLVHFLKIKEPGDKWDLPVPDDRSYNDQSNGRLLRAYALPKGRVRFMIQDKKSLFEDTGRKLTIDLDPGEVDDIIESWPIQKLLLRLKFSPSSAKDWTGKTMKKRARKERARNRGQLNLVK
jgi:hypothetical protein